MLGEHDRARDLLLAVDMDSAGRLGSFMKSLVSFVAGDREGTLTHLRALIEIPDPEARYYVARTMAHLGAGDEALPMLSASVDDGFFCPPAYTRDPWLDSVRGRPEFSALVRRAEARHRQALISFLTAEGNRVLGVAHPV
jgi:hypothetical protein